MPFYICQMIELEPALGSHNSSQRLAAALAAGTRPDDSQIDILVQRCSVEPDFFVRDMLTWALLRHSTENLYPKLLDELNSPISQAKSQALHTLTKIAHPESWKHVSDDLIFSEDSEVARAAWRLAAKLSPESVQLTLATKLCQRLGKGDHDFKLSLSRALAQIGEKAQIPLVDLAKSETDEISTHAKFTLALIENPELGESYSINFARKLDLLTGAPKVPD
jgi:HEAT repeat protein